MVKKNKKIVISEEVNPPVVNPDKTRLEVPKGLKRREPKSTTPQQKVVAEPSTVVPVKASKVIPSKVSNVVPQPTTVVPPKEAIAELPSVEPSKKRRRKVPILGRFQTPQLGKLSSTLAKMITGPSERWNLAPYRKVAEQLSTKGKDATVKSEAVKLLAIVTSLEQEKSELLWFEKSPRVTSMEGYEEEDQDFRFIPQPPTTLAPELIDKRPELLIKKYSKLTAKLPKKKEGVKPLYGPSQNLGPVDREISVGSTEDRPYYNFLTTEELFGPQSEESQQTSQMLPMPKGLPRVAPKTAPISPISVSEDILEEEVSKGMPGTSLQSSNLYREQLPDNMLQAQIENLSRRFKSDLFRQSEVQYIPSVTRNLEAKARKAKTQKELDKVMKDVIGEQTSKIQELLTKTLNSANILGTTAQNRMLREEKSKEPDEQLIAFYQEKIEEVKAMESSLGSYAESILQKITKQVNKTATEAYKKSSEERTQTELKKRKVEEEKILSKYQNQFSQALKQELELVASRTAFEEAQKFIDTESARGVSKEDIMPEARKVYDATKKEVLSKTKVQSKLSREEILGRYELQSKQFSKADFVSEVTEMPSFVNEARKFEVEFRTGLVKSGKDILDYFQKMGQSVPKQLEKQLLKPTFKAESGTVFGLGITQRNREQIAQELQSTFEAASGPQPYIPPTLQPKKTYADFVSEKVPSGILQSLAKVLTMTAEERQQAKTKTPIPPPSKPAVSGSGSGGSFSKSSLTPPGNGGGGGGFDFDSLGDFAARIGMIKVRLKMLGDVLTAVTAIPKEIFAITPEATTRQGASLGQMGGAFGKGIKTSATALGAAQGGFVGGSIGGAVLGTLMGGPIGTVTGAVAGSAIGSKFGSISGSLIGDPIPLLGEIADNTAKSVQAFSPQVLAERLDGQISMLKLNVDTANKYGSELAELQMYANTARQEMYKLGVEFLIEFKPFFEDMLALLIWLVGGLRSVMTYLYLIFEASTHFINLFAPVRWAAEAANEWFNRGKRKKDLGDPVLKQMGITGSFMLNRPFPGAKHQPLRERN